MSRLEPLLERNRAFAEAGGQDGVTPMPNQGLLVVSCMDPRVDPAQILGLGLGDALVLRNLGGRIGKETIRDIAFIASLTETLFGAEAPPFEVAIIHHTDCGARFLADDDFRLRFAERIGAGGQDLAAQAVTDPTVSVRADVKALLESPLVPGRVSVTGHVYDVVTGLVTTTEPLVAIG
jgi:carbonic anhydrase